MPSAISAPLTTMSITRNGRNTMKPMVKASLSSLRMKAGTRVSMPTSLRSFGRSRLATLVSSSSSLSSVLSSMNDFSGLTPLSNACAEVRVPSM